MNCPREDPRGWPHGHSELVRISSDAPEVILAVYCDDTGQLMPGWSDPCGGNVKGGPGCTCDPPFGKGEP